MPGNGSGLEPASLELLLNAVETPEAAISGAVLDDYHAFESVALKNAGLLKPDGHEAASASLTDHDDVPVTLSWSAEDGGLGYFSPTAGWVTVVEDRIARFRVDFPVLLARLMVQTDVSSRSGPAPLVPDLLWEIGDVRLGRRTQRVPIWFARRLHERSVWRQINDIAKARPTSGLRVVLTSTPSHRFPDEVIAGHLLVGIRDVIDFATGLTIHPDILAARLDGSHHRSGELLSHSADYSVITVHGKDYRFTGVKQRALVSQLVEAFKAGSPVCLTAKVLEDAGYRLSVNTVAKAFSRRSDWREFIAEDGGSCWIFT